MYRTAPALWTFTSPVRYGNWTKIPQNGNRPSRPPAGVDAYWLDETDGEGTGGGGDGDYGYNTSYGPAMSYSNLWVNDWISMFSDPVAAQPGQVAPPLVLTRSVWAGGQRHGVVLWSSDIHSSFEQLASQVPQGVHASMSGIPWWTTDVGGYGCDQPVSPTDPYMRQLIVRWYQFGAFSPVFRTHGCRAGPSEPNTKQCAPAQGSCGYNEIWSYGSAAQVRSSFFFFFFFFPLFPGNACCLDLRVHVPSQADWCLRSHALAPRSTSAFR